MICSVCRVREISGFFLCRPCHRSYAKAMDRCTTMWTAIEWAAKRTRRFASRKKP